MASHNYLYQMVQKSNKILHNPCTTFMVFSLSFKIAISVPNMDLTVLNGAATARTIVVMHLAPARPDARTQNCVLQVRMYPPKMKKDANKRRLFNKLLLFVLQTTLICSINCSDLFIKLLLFVLQTALMCSINCSNLFNKLLIFFLQTALICTTNCSNLFNKLL